MVAPNRCDENWKTVIAGWLFLAGAVILLLAGCANLGAPAVSELPKWVSSGNAEEFPRNRYMYATACAPSRQLADEKARAALAKQFRVRIAQEFRATRTRHRLDNNEVSAGSHVSQRTRSQAVSELEGVEIRKRYAGERQSCSLALIDRQAAINSTIAEVQEVDDTTRELIESIRNTQDTIERVIERKRVVRLAQQSKRLHARIRVLNMGKPSGEGPPVSPEDAMQQYQSAVSQVVVGIQGLGNDAQSLIQVLEEQLTRCGLSLQHKTEANVRVLVRLHFQPGSRRSDKYKWLAYRFRAQAKNSASDMILASASSTDEVAHRSSAKAKIVAIETIKEEVLPTFIEDLCAWWKDNMELSPEGI